MNIISFCEFSYIGIFIICTSVFTIYKFCHFPIMKYWFASALKYDHLNFTLFFFFLESFNLWRLLLMIALYHQIKISINFWCRRGSQFYLKNKDSFHSFF